MTTQDLDTLVEEFRSEGRAEKAREMLRRIVRVRFGDVAAASVDGRIGAAELGDLDRWADRALLADRVEDAFD